MEAETKTPRILDAISSIGGAIIGIATVRYLGSYLLLPLLSALLIGWVVWNAASERIKPFTATIALQSGHVLWFLIGILYAGSGFQRVIVDVAMIATGLIWLWRKPGPAPLILLLSYQAVAVLSNIVTFFTAEIAGTDRRALVAHVLLRIAALAIMRWNLLELRRAETPPVGNLVSAETAPPMPFVVRTDKRTTVIASLLISWATTLFLWNLVSLIPGPLRTFFYGEGKVNAGDILQPLIPLFFGIAMFRGKTWALQGAKVLLWLWIVVSPMAITAADDWYSIVFVWLFSIPLLFAMYGIKSKLKTIVAASFSTIVVVLFNLFAVLGVVMPDQATPMAIIQEGFMRGETYASPRLRLALVIPSGWKVRDRDFTAGIEDTVLEVSASNADFVLTKYAGGVDSIEDFAANMRKYFEEHESLVGPLRTSNVTISGAPAVIFLGDIQEQGVLRTYEISCFSVGDARYCGIAWSKKEDYPNAKGAFSRIVSSINLIE